ncbi:MAG: HAMP domain-containing sensor histidine kinase [Bacteroidia bacterium]|nr:HAMP domain-containing sensor histidine kinase [Bacteroidia bacterium]
MSKLESLSKPKYQEYLLEKVADRGIIVPIVVFGVVSLFTIIDYVSLGLDSIYFRSLALIPLLGSILAYSIKASGKVLMFLQQSWLLGGNIMMAGLAYIVFSEHQDDFVLKYGTIVGYSIAIYISILISYDRSILWIIALPLAISSIGLYVSMQSLEWVLMANLYVVVGVSFALVSNQHSQEYSLFKERLVTEELNDRLEQFGHIAAHDLRSPLGIISTHIGIVRRRINEGAYDRVNDNFKLIESTVVNMDKLLGDILAYSRDSMDEAENSWVDLESILMRVKEDLSELFEQAGGEMEISQDLPSIYGSSARMYQVFYNLVLNSIKYRNSKWSLQVIIESYTKQGNAFVLVHDNGLGIPKHLHRKVFEPFERFHLDVPGSGLGLSMVKKHIELHGGFVSLESSEGKGSSFSIQFPKRIVRAKVL